MVTLVSFFVFGVNRRADMKIWPVTFVGSSGLGIIKKGGVELIIKEPLLIKNLSFLMLLDSIRLLL